MTIRDAFVEVHHSHGNHRRIRRRFLQAEGAEGHGEGIAPVVFWNAAFDWLETTLLR